MGRITIHGKFENKLLAVGVITSVETELVDIVPRHIALSLAKVKSTTLPISGATLPKHR